MSDTTIHYIPEADYNKAIGQLRMQLSGVFHDFNMYGLGDMIPGAKEVCIRL